MDVSLQGSWGGMCPVFHTPGSAPGRIVSWTSLVYSNYYGCVHAQTDLIPEHNLKGAHQSYHFFSYFTADMKYPEGLHPQDAT